MTHGDLDDNVHMQNSIYLISRLQDEGKSFQFMLYPNGRHGWGGAKAIHSRTEANKFWLREFLWKRINNCYFGVNFLTVNSRLQILNSKLE